MSFLGRNWGFLMVSQTSDNGSTPSSGSDFDEVNAGDLIDNEEAVDIFVENDDKGEKQSEAAALVSLDPGEPVSIVGEKGASVDEGRLQQLELMLTGLRDSFEERLKYDQFKEKQIDRLHDELQEYKRDLIGKATRPLINGVVRLHNDMGRLRDSLSEKADDTLSMDKVIGIVTGLQEDVEILLGQHGIERVERTDSQFDPKVQTVVRKVSTADPGLNGLVAEALRPGFEMSDGIVQKEKVGVYKYEETFEENKVPQSSTERQATETMSSKTGATDGE